jgi:Helix-turn-helix domain/Bacterial regulatory proteins, gntR family
MTGNGNALALWEVAGAGHPAVTIAPTLASRPRNRGLPDGGVSASIPKYVHAAKLVRLWIAEGALGPGEIVPSGMALARVTGYSSLTCRRALRELVKDGTLVPGPSPNARPRVPFPGPAQGRRQVIPQSARALSAGLASRRHALGLTQPAFADLVGYSVTTVGHAETGRIWQSRGFWEEADKALRAGGELLRLHSAWQADSSPFADNAADDADGNEDDHKRADLLTEDEREVVRQAGQLYTLIADRIVAHGPTRDDDLAELRAAIHVIQRAMEAQAAARAYPREFRLLGTVIPKTIALGSAVTGSHPDGNLAP